MSVDIGTPQPRAKDPPRNDQEVEKRGRDQPADGGRGRQGGRAPSRQSPYGELALDLKADDQEEDGEEPVVDPFQERQREAQAVEYEAELLLPEGVERCSKSDVGKGDREQRREQQEEARRRSPAHEIERRGAHAVAERAVQGVGEGAVVPRTVISAAVDEEGRRDQGAARRRARLVRLDPGLGAKRGLVVGRIVLHAEIGGRLAEIVRGQHLRPGHELHMRVPEALGVASALDQFRRRMGKIVAGERLVAKHIAKAVAELVPDFRNPLVCGATIRAGIAAVFDERNRSVDRPQNVVLLVVDRPIQPIA